MAIKIHFDIACEDNFIYFLLTDTATKQQVSLLLSEGTSMLGAVHKNVLPILAVNSDNPMQPLLVYPYANKGNLKRLTVNDFNGASSTFYDQLFTDIY